MGFSSYLSQEIVLMKSGMEESIESDPNNFNLLLSFWTVRATQPIESDYLLHIESDYPLYYLLYFPSDPFLPKGIVGSVIRPVRISTHLVTHLESPTVNALERLKDDRTLINGTLRSGRVLYRSSSFTPGCEPLVSEALRESTMGLSLS